MLSAGEWIRNKRFLGLRNNLSTDISPVFNSVKQPGVGTTFSVGSVKNLRTTGVSRIRNVASDRTSLIALRAGTYLSKSEVFNTLTGFSTDISAITVNSLCGCQSGTVNKRGLCPTCRNL
jgi:hypothetical protein